MINKAENIFESLQGLSLAQIEEVALMNRIDNKYVFPLSQLPEIIERVKSHYDILEINDKKLMKYSTIYYDTVDFELYRTHHRGKLNRYKVRERTYVDSDVSFTEVKFKNNQQNTLKSRIKVDTINVGFDKERTEFIAEVSDINANDLEAKLWVDYKRATLVSKQKNERSTIDLGLHFYFDNNEKKFEEIVIVETKRDSKVKSTPMMAALKEFQIRPGGFSKYCMGITQIYPEMKRNSFKRKIIQVSKIKEQHITD